MESTTEPGNDRGPTEDTSLPEDGDRPAGLGPLAFVLQVLEFDGPTLGALFASIALQLAPVLYLVLYVPPPPRSSGELTLPDDRFVAMLIEEEPEEPPPPEPEDPELVQPPEPEPLPEREELEEEAAEPAAEAPPPDALAVETIGAGEGEGVSFAPGSGSMAQATSGDRHAERQREEPEQAPPAAPPQRRQPVRLEEARVPPEPIRMEPPIGYPREFRERALTGLVVVQCIITERGAVRACRARSGPEQLAEYAISIVRQWRYSPAQDDSGEPIPVAFTWRIPFRLS